MTNLPLTKIQDGLITATIWKNESSQGKPFFTVTLSRSYQKDDKWFETKSFAGADLLKIARLAQAAYSQIQKAKRETVSVQHVN